MDVVQGDFSFDVRSGKVQSSVAKNGFLDPELANEGERALDKIILSDGEQVSWTPPQVKPVMPDWTTIKSLAKYFNRTGHQTWPCWFYHPAHKEILIKDAEEAHEKFGVKRRRATDRERANFGAGEWVWDTPEGCEWRPAPYPQNMPKMDLGNGKHLVVSAPNPQIAQHALIEQLVTAMQGGQNALLAQLVTALAGGTMLAAGAPVDVEASEWEEFQQFQAFKRAQQSDSRPAAANSSVDEGKGEWIAKAEEIGIKVDRRWSADKIRNHVMTELERRVAAAEAGVTEGAELASELRDGDLLPGAMGDPLGR